MTKFTPKEIEFLEHRLVLDEALHEVLSDEDDGEFPKCTRDEVWIECQRLLGDMRLGKTAEEIVASLSPLGQAVLRDAIEGSTWVASIPSNMPEEAPRLRAARRVARAAAEKLRNAGLVTMNAPED